MRSEWIIQIVNESDTDIFFLNCMAPQDIVD